MFRGLTLKFLPAKSAKRFIVLIGLVIFIWITLIWVTIYIEDNQSNVISLDDISVSFPRKISVSEPGDIAAAIQFKEYKSKNNDLWVKFPQAFTIREEIFNGRDIIYHLEVKGYDNIHGYVQIWQINTTMLDFLNNAKKFGSPNIYEFKEKEIALGNNIKGYKWSYLVKRNNGDVVARQSFLSKPGSKKMYILSLYIPKEDYSKDFETLYDDILYSVRFR